MWGSFSGWIWHLVTDWIFEPMAGDDKRFFTRPTIVMLCFVGFIALIWGLSAID